MSTHVRSSIYETEQSKFCFLYIFIDTHEHDWASTRENLSSGEGGGVGNNTGADQPAHPRSLISAFVTRVL